MKTSNIITKNWLAASVMTVLMMAASEARAQEIFRMESAPATVQLRTNSLYYLALCPNIGVEIQTDLGLAWQLDYIGAWWNSPSHNRFFSNYGFQTEVRYYLANKKMQMPYSGHHAGIYGQMATFDFEFGGTGYLSRNLDYSYGIGISYGYSLAISRRWNLDLTAGVGYFQSKYDVYEPVNGVYMKEKTKMLRTFFPTKLEVSFVWNINAKNNK